MNSTKQHETIIVEGNFTPNIIHFNQGQKANLTFDRLNNMSCLDRVQSKDLDFNLYLPVNSPQTVSISTNKVGTFTFGCIKDDVQGKIVID